MSSTVDSMRLRPAVLCLALLVGLTLPIIAQAEEEFTDVYRLGRSATRFSPDSAIEFVDFQKQFAHYRSDVEKVLAIAGWQGNVDALFAAVRDAKDEEGAVRFINGEPGTVLQWMALRRKGEPAIIKNVRWAAKVPFPAWQVTVEDGDRRSIFVVPQWCMNLSLDREEKIEKKVVAEPTPPPPPPLPSPECRLSAMVDDNGMLKIDASASKGEVELTGVTLPDGSAADLGMLTDAGEGMWSFDTSDYVGRKPADYSFSVAAVSRLSGKDDTCQTSAVFTKAGSDSRWIARGFAGWITSDADDQRWATNLPSGAEERNMVGIGDGTGFGLGLEYLFSERWGVDVRVLFGNLDNHWMYDLQAIWLMDEQDVNYLPITVGVNYHFTPDSKVDVYAGPFIGYTSFGSTQFRDSDLSLKVDFDSAFTAGVLLGLDIPFGDSPWIFTGGVSYSATDADARAGDGTEIDFNVNPLTTVFGIGYKF